MISPLATGALLALLCLQTARAHADPPAVKEPQFGDTDPTGRYIFKSPGEWMSNPRWRPPPNPPAQTAPAGSDKLPDVIAKYQQLRDHFLKLAQDSSSQPALVQAFQAQARAMDQTVRVLQKAQTDGYTLANGNLVAPPSPPPPTPLNNNGDTRPPQEKPGDAPQTPSSPQQPANGTAGANSPLANPGASQTDAAGSPGGGNADWFFKGGPVAQATGSGGDSAIADQISRPKQGLADGNGVGGKLGGLKNALGSSAETGGMFSGGGLSEPAARDGAGRGPAAAKPAGTASTTADRFDGFNQRTASEIRRTVAPEHLRNLSSDYARNPSATDFKHMEPWTYSDPRTGAGNLDTFRWAKSCKPPDDCNTRATYPYSRGQLVRGETLNAIPGSKAAKDAKDDKGDAKGRRDKARDRAETASVWARVGELLAKARGSPSPTSIFSHHSSFADRLSSILSRLSGRPASSTGGVLASAGMAASGAGAARATGAAVPSVQGKAAGPARGAAPTPNAVPEEDGRPFIDPLGALALLIALSAGGGLLWLFFKRRDD